MTKEIETIEVTVTEEDRERAASCRNSVPRSCGCPIAQALRRLGYFASVGSGHICISDMDKASKRGTGIGAPNQKAVRDFIEAEDLATYNGRDKSEYPYPKLPFTFTLTVTRYKA